MTFFSYFLSSTILGAGIATQKDDVTTPVSSTFQCDVPADVGPCQQSYSKWYGHCLLFATVNFFLTPFICLQVL